MVLQPIRWPAWSEWRAVLVRTFKEAGDDNVGLLAAGVGFYGFLAFVPLLAATVLVYGLVADPPTVAEHIRALFGALPRDAAALIGDQLKAMTDTPDAAKGWSLVVAIALAIYGASKGSGAIVTALNIAYEVKETRGFLKTTLLSLAMTVGALIVLLIAAAAISMMGWVEALFPAFPGWAHVALQILFWTLAVAAAAVGLACVYRYAPSRPDAPWMWISPGSAAATLLWLLASLGFGLYVSHFGNYNATYGSLGGVVVFLTWMYLTAYIILMGGELNSELERQQAIEAKAETPASAPSAPAAAPQPERVEAPRPTRPPAEPRSRVPVAGVAALLGAGWALRKWRHRRHRGEDYLPGGIARAVRLVGDPL